MSILSLFGIGASISLAAIGTALGSGAAGMASIGAWKKCYLQNKPAPFLLLVITGLPLSQFFYGMLIMNKLMEAAPAAKDNVVIGSLILGVGILGGLAEMFSAFFQGKAGAMASDSLAETGKGFINYLMVLGIIETPGLFAFVFLSGAVDNILKSVQ